MHCMHAYLVKLHTLYNFFIIKYLYTCWLDRRMNHRALKIYKNCKVYKVWRRTLCLVKLELDKGIGFGWTKKLLELLVGFVDRSSLSILTSKKHFRWIWSFPTRPNDDMQLLDGVCVCDAIIPELYPWPMCWALQDIHPEKPEDRRQAVKASLSQSCER